jgi:ketosteroid isomerase-like protein
VKRLLICVTLIGLGVLVAGYSAWGKNSSTNEQRLANLYQINQIEKTWHKAASKKNLKLMMSLWAPRATFTVSGKTYTGKTAIRHLFERSGPFQSQNHWISDTAAYKIRTTVNGNKGTLYFECHYIDVDTGKVATTVGADQEVRRINGKWLIIDATAATVTLRP